MVECGVESHVSEYEPVKAFVNVVMNFRCHKILGNFLTSCRTISF